MMIKSINVRKLIIYAICATAYAMTLNQLKLGIGQRGFIVGQTGSGKSELARQLIPATGSLLIVDAKREFDFPDLKIINNPRQLRKAGRYIYRPNPDLLASIPAYNFIYKLAYESGYNFIYTDELIPLLRGYNPPKYFNVCLQLGRSKGLTMLTCTQRPSAIPRAVLSESQKFYAFRLQDELDVKRIAQVIPNYIKPAIRHSFNYFDALGNNPVGLVKLSLKQ